MDGLLLIATGEPDWPAMGVNERLCALTGFSGETLVGSPWPTLWEPRQAPEPLAQLQRAVAAGEEARVRIPTLRHELEPFDSVVEVEPMQGAPGLCVLAIRPAGVAATEVSTGLVDPLTGLDTRAAFEHRLEAELSRSLREDTRIALLFLDLDRFKPVNDTFGHSVGDEVLRAVGARLHEALRAEDMVARFGGDEFVILLAGLDAAALKRAQAVAEHVCHEIARPIEVSAGWIEVGASVGIGVFPDDAQDGLGLLDHADAGMYRAKRSGQESAASLRDRAKRAQARAVELHAVAETLLAVTRSRSG